MATESLSTLGHQQKTCHEKGDLPIRLKVSLRPDRGLFKVRYQSSKDCLLPLIFAFIKFNPMPE
jgi:hypothetical protein